MPKGKTAKPSVLLKKPQHRIAPMPKPKPIDDNKKSPPGRIMPRPRPYPSPRPLPNPRPKDKPKPKPGPIPPKDKPKSKPKPDLPRWTPDGKIDKPRPKDEDKERRRSGQLKHFLKQAEGMPKDKKEKFLAEIKKLYWKDIISVPKQPKGKGKDSRTQPGESKPPEKEKSLPNMIPDWAQKDHQDWPPYSKGKKPMRKDGMGKLPKIPNDMPNKLPRPKKAKSLGK